MNNATMYIHEHTNASATLYEYEDATMNTMSLLWSRFALALLSPYPRFALALLSPCSRAALALLPARDPRLAAAARAGRGQGPPGPARPGCRRRL